MEKHLFSGNNRVPNGRCVLCDNKPSDHPDELHTFNADEFFSSGDSRDYEKFPHRSG